MLCLFAATVMLASAGCGSTNNGRYFQRTGRKTHVHRDRIRNPSDFRNIRLQV
jgi:hypothetical protein